jgi:two-component system, sensor histidine kinase
MMEISSNLALRKLSKERQLSVRREQIDLLWRNAPAGYVANVVVALAVTVILSKALGFSIQLWFAGVVAVTLIRCVFAYFYFTSSRENRDPNFWGKLFIGLTFLTGLTWGVLGGVLFPQADPYGQSLIVVVVVGITAGAVVTNGFVAMAYYVYLVTALAPYVIRAFGGDQRFDMPLGVLAVIYAGFMVVAARRTNQNLVSNLVSIHQLEEITRELNRA